MKKKIKKEKGFTLIEMLVSMTLFSFVVTVALGALFSILKANEKTKIIKTVVNNLNVALEGMSREIRVGYGYICGSDDECTEFKFKTKDGCNASYKFDDDTIYKWIKKGPSCGDGDTNWVSIIGDDLTIEDLKFRTTGLSPGPPQPSVLINLRGSMSRPNIKKEVFNIQTRISQRKIQP